MQFGHGFGNRFEAINGFAGDGASGEIGGDIELEMEDLDRAIRGVVGGERSITGRKKGRRCFLVDFLGKKRGVARENGE